MVNFMRLEKKNKLGAEFSDYLSSPGLRKVTFFFVNFWCKNTPFLRYILIKILSIFNPIVCCAKIHTSDSARVMVSGQRDVSVEFGIVARCSEYYFK